MHTVMQLYKYLVQQHTILSTAFLVCLFVAFSLHILCHAQHIQPCCALLQCCYVSIVKLLDAYQNSPWLTFLQQQKFESASLVSSPLLIADCELWSYRLGRSHPGGSLHDVGMDPMATSVFHPTAHGI